MKKSITMFAFAFSTMLWASDELTDEMLRNVSEESTAHVVYPSAVELEDEVDPIREAAEKALTPVTCKKLEEIELTLTKLWEGMCYRRGRDETEVVMHFRVTRSEFEGSKDKGRDVLLFFLSTLHNLIAKFSNKSAAELHMTVEEQDSITQLGLDALRKCVKSFVDGDDAIFEAFSCQERSLKEACEMVFSAPVTLKLQQMAVLKKMRILGKPSLLRLIANRGN